MASMQPLKILSLDGGGVRGIATLYLLRGLMHQIALSTNHRPESLRPCDYFDLIAGTSTGGLIAIMLGRLRFTVEEAIEKYIALSESIFSALSSQTDAQFDHRILEKRIKQVVAEAPCPRPETLTADELFKDETVGTPHNERILTGEPMAGCRTFVVCTIPRGSGFRPEILRSYKTPYDFPFSGKIWEAARATSAAPTSFAPITVDHVTYGDGGTGWNNPTTLVISEVRQIWPDRPVGCLISLGTGEEDMNQLVTADKLPKKGLRKKFFNSSMPKSSFKLEVARYCTKCLMSCMRTHEDVLSHLERDRLVGSYFRLNTPGVGKIGLEEWKQIDDMIDLTVDYLNAPDTKRMKFVIASKMIYYQTLLVAPNKLQRPELDSSGSLQELPVRLLDSAGREDLLDDHRLEASTSTGKVVSNTRSNSFSKPVAHLLSFAAYCCLVGQRFDAVQHVAPSLHRLHLSVMGLTQFLRQVCHNILTQVPSSTPFNDLSQVEDLLDPDNDIPLLLQLQKDVQIRIDFFRIIYELQKNLNGMDTELDKLMGRIAGQKVESDIRQIEALVESCQFYSIHAELKISGSCFKLLATKLCGNLFEKDQISRSDFVEDKTPRPTNTSNIDPLTMDPSVARSRLIRQISREVYWALRNACRDHASHSAQFQLRPHHAIERGSQTFVVFQVRFLGDITNPSPTDTAFHGAWLSIKSPCEEIRCVYKRGKQRVLEKRAFSSKEKLTKVFAEGIEAEPTPNKRVNQQPKSAASQLGNSTKFFGLGPENRTFASPSSPAKGINFSARTNFCSRVMAYNQRQCIDPHRYLGFFRAETNTEHRVFFSGAYQKLGQCQPTSLYEVFTTIVPVSDRKSFQYERVELAKQLASAMLQFQNSPMLQNYWGGNDIVFFRQPDSEGNVRSMLSAPYLNVQIKSSSQSSTMNRDEDNAFQHAMGEAFVKNEYLFQLATLFIEIAYQSEMEDLISPDEVLLYENDPELERWFIADRLCNDISSNLGSQYRAIVRLCLDYSLKDDHLIMTDRYENMICREVVNELEELKIAMVDELFG